MKVSEMVKLLKGIGCYKKREGDNHEIWYSPITCKLFQVPRHYAKELPTGTEHKIKRDSGLI